MYGSGNDELSLEAAIADTVSEEVKKQIDSGPDSAVDWSRVSEVAGVSQLKCLEVNHCDDGKAEWVYDVETFSWDKAKKMTDFIEANYPEPVPVNFKAVSNYMWTRLSDCAQMYNLLKSIH
ncbi:hypothetical protein GGI07_004944 [Coemansia sp. Benny D115]|nr:hypothetical protein GGI07_004944 [Coemansia sp. Benny D115]